ncbi:hypothetical protein [Microbacterium sp. GXF0217]
MSALSRAVNQLQVSRRGFVTGTSILLLTSSLNLRANTGHKQLQTGSAKITVDRTTDVACFAPDGTVRYAVEFPEVILLPDVPLKLVTVTWDPRIFIVEPSAVAVLHGDTDRTMLVPVDATEQSLTFSPGQGTTRLILSARSAATYPNDLVSEPLPTNITTDSESQTLQIQQHAASAWGAELLTSWVIVGAEYVPSLIQINSYGPNPTPSGLVIATRLTPGGSNHVEGRASKSRSTANREGPKHEALYQVAERIEPGALWTMTFDVKARRSTEDGMIPKLKAIPTVDLVVPEPEAPNSRITDLHSSAPLTNSGFILSDYTKSETA